MKWFLFLTILFFTTKVFTLEGYVETTRKDIKMGDVVEAQLYLWPLSKIPILEKTLYLGEKAFFIINSGPVTSENNNEVVMTKGHIVFAEPATSGEKIPLKVENETILVEMRSFSVANNPDMVLDQKLIIRGQQKYSKTNIVFYLLLALLISAIGYLLFNRKKFKLKSPSSKKLSFEIKSATDLHFAYKKRDEIKRSIGEEKYNKFLGELGELIFKPTLTSDELLIIQEKFKSYGL